MKVKLLLGILAITLLASCVKGVKTDFIRGISYSYNGLTLKNVVTYDSYKREMNTNKLPENSTLYVEFQGIGNFTKENGKVFPGCDLQVKDQAGNVVMEQKDLYADYSDGIDESGFDNLYVNVRLADPIVGGKKYDVEIHMYDKKNSENVVDVKVEVNLSGNDLKIEKTEKGLIPENIFLFDQESGLLPSNIVKLYSEVAIILVNTEGFTERDGFVYPGCELTVTDKSGNKIMYDEDIYANLGNCPVDQVNQLTATIIYANPIVANETYTVTLHLFDKADTSKELLVSMDIKVIENIKG